jgi:hypothetical protein
VVDTELMKQYEQQLAQAETIPLPDEDDADF